MKDVWLTSGSVTANGVMFWCGLKFDKDDTHVIVSFDIATEVFSVIPWPDSARYGCEFAVHDGKLAIISYGDKRKTVSSRMKEGMKGDISLYFSVMEKGVDERGSCISGEVGEFARP